MLGYSSSNSYMWTAFKGLKSCVQACIKIHECSYCWCMHRYEHIVFPFSLVVLVKPRAWSIYRQVFCHLRALPDPEHIFARCQMQEWFAYSFQHFKLKKKKCCVLTHSLCLRQLIFSAGDWIYSLHSLSEYYKLSYILFPCPLWKFCGKRLTEFPSWTWICLELVMLLHSPWGRWDHSSVPAGLAFRKLQVWRWLCGFQFVHHCSVQCYDVAKNKTVAASWM